MTTMDVALRCVLARDAMSSPVVTIAPSATLWEAWRLMMASGLRHLVVSDEQQVVGVLEDRAVFAHWPMGPLALRTARDITRLTAKEGMWRLIV
jgi:signal-transduction protein with cAMP-binding, CBS, and nucleotidyltransferase domain